MPRTTPAKPSEKSPESPAEPPRKTAPAPQIPAPQIPARKIQVNRSWSQPALAVARFGKFDKKLLNAVLSRAAKLALGAPALYAELQKSLDASPHSPLELDCFWVDDAEIQRMNREHRAKDKPTDVLSFPLFEGEVFAFPGEDLALGDLVISIETAARQAGELGHPLEHEVAFLTIHGALHLLGYDHATDGQRRKMFALQDELFEQWKAGQK